MYERILVPTDGSAGVERAVCHALEIARAHDAELHGVYVVNAAGYGGLPMETSWDGIRDALSEEGSEAVERLAALAGEAGVPVETSVLEGSPARRIVQYAEEADCDLIVMGTHGRGGLDRLLLGSVAERVVRCSEVPVLTVRVSREEAEAEVRALAETGDRASATVDDGGAPAGIDGDRAPAEVESDHAPAEVEDGGPEADEGA